MQSLSRMYLIFVNFLDLLDAMTLSYAYQLIRPEKAYRELREARKGHLKLSIIHFAE